MSSRLIGSPPEPRRAQARDAGRDRQALTAGEPRAPWRGIALIVVVVIEDHGDHA